MSRLGDLLWVAALAIGLMVTIRHVETLQGRVVDLEARVAALESCP